MSSRSNRSFFRWNWHAFLCFALLFSMEVIIALFVNDRIIRPYGGDFLAVIMLYYLLKSFLNTHYGCRILITLSIAYLIEIAQGLNLLTLLGAEKNLLLRILFGSTYSWGDMIAYTLGAMTCWLIEYALNSSSTYSSIKKSVSDFP